MSQWYTNHCIAFVSIWKYLLIDLNWKWGSRRFSMQLVAMNQNWSMRSSTHPPSDHHIFWIMMKIKKDITCLMETEEQTIHATRPRSGRVVYTKIEHLSFLHPHKHLINWIMSYVRPYVDRSNNLMNLWIMQNKSYFLTIK